MAQRWCTMSPFMRQFGRLDCLRNRLTRRCADNNRDECAARKLKQLNDILEETLLAAWYLSILSRVHTQRRPPGIIQLRTFPYF